MGRRADYGARVRGGCPFGLGPDKRQWGEARDHWFQGLSLEDVLLEPRSGDVVVVECGQLFDHHPAPSKLLTQPR